MRKAPYRRALGEVPPEHVPARPPATKTALPAPRQRAAGRPPNPRTPRPVRDVSGGMLKDLFELFPDLPRPARPAARLRGQARKIRRQ